MSPKNPKLPKKKSIPGKNIDPDSLKGFEELLEYFNYPQETDKGSESLYNDTFSLYTFLDIEQNRLEQLSDLFSWKLQNVERFPQHELIREMKKHEVEKTKAEVVDLMVPPESIFNKNLKTIWEGNF
jgi:hypothetical protein